MPEAEIIKRKNGFSAESAIKRSKYVHDLHKLPMLTRMDPHFISGHMNLPDEPCPLNVNTTTIRNCLGIVRDKNKSIVGGCFKISPLCLMTCFHVFHRLGKEPHTGSYDFPYLGGNVKNPKVVKTSEGFDIVIIEFDSHGGEFDGGVSFLKLQASPSFISIKNDTENELPVFINGWDGKEITHPFLCSLRQFESVHVLHTLENYTMPGFPLIDPHGNAFAMHRVSTPEGTPAFLKCNLAVRFDLWLYYDFSIGDEDAFRSRREGEAFFRSVGTVILMKVDVSKTENPPQKVIDVEKD